MSAPESPCPDLVSVPCACGKFSWLWELDGLATREEQQWYLLSQDLRCPGCGADAPHWREAEQALFNSGTYEL